MNYSLQESHYKGILRTKETSSLSEKEQKEVALIYNNLGFSKYMQVNFDDAVKDYDKAIQLDESLAVAYYNRGTILYRMGCFQDALKDFHKSVSLDSSNMEFKTGLEACKQRML